MGPFCLARDKEKIKMGIRTSIDIIYVEEHNLDDLTNRIRA
jgi:hypothetical protein